MQRSSLTACGNKRQADNTLNVDENLAAENIVSNDVTAIDAVTGDASNMAADVNYIEPTNIGGTRQCLDKDADTADQGAGQAAARGVGSPPPSQ